MRRYIYLVLLVLLCLKSISQEEPEKIRYPGPENINFNLLVIGEGYTDTQINDGTYRDDIYKFVTPIFDSITPFKQYQSFFNVFSINIKSNKTGITHKQKFRSSDSLCLNLDEKSVNNYFSTSLDNQLHRSYSTKNDKIVKKRSEYLNFSHLVVVLANTSEYSGTSWPEDYFLIIPKHFKSKRILAHELGHSIGLLCDEYCDNGCNDIINCANISLSKNHDEIPWKDWIGRNGIGIEDRTTSSFRPSNNCRMRSSDFDFCSVCTEQIILKLYDQVNILKGYYPPGYAKISRNERNITVPDTIKVDEIKLFKLYLLKPEPNTLRITWFLKDEVIRNDTSTSVLISPGNRNGIYELKAVVTETTDYLFEKKTICSVKWNLSLNGTKKQINHIDPNDSGRINITQPLPQPLVENGNPIEEDVTFYFDHNSSIANNVEEGLKRFDSIVDTVNINYIEIIGYTDSTGTETYNDSLSQWRADYVKTLLSNKYEYAPLPVTSCLGGGVSRQVPDIDLRLNRRADVFIVKRSVKK